MMQGQAKRGENKAWFNEAEVNGIIGFEKGEDCFEVECGCTNTKYGDFVGRLTVKASGQFLITCHCFEGCTKVNVTPKEFEKHVEVMARKWTSNIWVQLEANGERIGLGKSLVMKYYNHKANVDNWIKFANRNKKFHNDKFVRCCKCNKERRFRRRTIEAIKGYHDAINDESWECSDWPYDEITCDEEEERENRKLYLGCPRVKHCQGCNYCNCSGCLKCRFPNCNCQECNDFMIEGKP